MVTWELVGSLGIVGYGLGAVGPRTAAFVLFAAALWS